MLVLSRRFKVVQVFVNFIYFYTMHNANVFVQDKLGETLDTEFASDAFLCACQSVVGNLVHSEPPMSASVPHRPEAAEMRLGLFRPVYYINSMPLSFSEACHMPFVGLARVNPLM